MEDDTTKDVAKDEQRDSKGRFLPGVKPAAGKPWQPGQSGNPNGRRMESALKRRLQRASTLEKAVGTIITVATDTRHPSWAKAMGMLLDRVDGSVAKKLEIEGELPLKVTVRGSRD